MGALQDALGVTRRGFVVALSGIASPGRTVFRKGLSGEGKRTGGVQQHASGSDQGAIEKIAARNRLVQTKNFIEMRTPSHSTLPSTSFGRLRSGIPGRAFACRLWIPEAVFFGRGVDVIFSATACQGMCGGCVGDLELAGSLLRS